MLLQLLRVTHHAQQQNLSGQTDSLYNIPQKVLQSLVIHCSVMANNWKGLDHDLYRFFKNNFKQAGPEWLSYLEVTKLFILSFICCFFNVPESSSDYTASNDSIINEWTGWRSGCCLIWGTIQHLPARTKENDAENTVRTADLWPEMGSTNLLNIRQAAGHSTIIFSSTDSRTMYSGVAAHSVIHILGSTF
jgi:hypothetical protein